MCMENAIGVDFHTHTRYSHGKNTPEQNVNAAIARGLRCVAISEHGPASLFFGVRREKLQRLRQEVDRLNQRYANDIRVLLGIECNLVGDGVCDLPQDSAMFDVVLLGFHRAVRLRDSMMRRAALARRHPPARRDDAGVARAVLHTLERYPVDVVTHPGQYLPMDIATLARGAARLGVLLEINEKHQSLSPAQLRQAAAQGAWFVANSDAHRADRVGVADRAIEAARSAGVLDRVVNRQGGVMDASLRLARLGL